MEASRTLRVLTGSQKLKVFAVTDCEDVDNPPLKPRELNSLSATNVGADASPVGSSSEIDGEANASAMDGIEVLEIEVGDQSMSPRRRSVLAARASVVAFLGKQKKRKRTHLIIAAVIVAIAVVVGATALTLALLLWPNLPKFGAVALSFEAFSIVKYEAKLLSQKVTLDIRGNISFELLNPNAFEVAVRPFFVVLAGYGQPLVHVSFANLVIEPRASPGTSAKSYLKGVIAPPDGDEFTVVDIGFGQFTNLLSGAAADRFDVTMDTSIPCTVKYANAEFRDVAVVVHCDIGVKFSSIAKRSGKGTSVSCVDRSEEGY